MNWSKFWRVENSVDRNDQLGRDLACGLAAVFALAVLAAPTALRAQSSHAQLDELSESEQRRILTHVKKGKQAYDRGDYRRSLDEFEAAFDGLEHPDFAYRIALAHEKLGNTREAIGYFERVLELDPDAPDRDDIRERIAELEGQLEGEIVVTSEPSGAIVRLGVGGRALGRTRFEGRIPVGKHLLIVEKSEHESVQKRVEVESGSVQNFHIILPPASTPTQPKSTSSAPYWLMGVGGGIGAAGAVVSYVMFRNHRRAVERADRDQAEPPDYQNHVDQAVFWDRAAWISGGVGIAALTAGATWLLLSSGGEDADRADKRNRRIHVAPTVGARGGSLQLRLDF